MGLLEAFSSLGVIREHFMKDKPDCHAIENKDVLYCVGSRNAKQQKERLLQAPMPNAQKDRAQCEFVLSHI